MLGEEERRVFVCVFVGEGGVFMGGGGEGVWGVGHGRRREGGVCLCVYGERREGGSWRRVNMCGRGEEGGHGRCVRGGGGCVHG